MSGNKLQQAGANAPAFPQNFDFIGPTWNPLTDKTLVQGQRERTIFMGVTRREYFMARAPMPAPKWFNPVMRPCPAVPSVLSIESDDLRVRVRSYLNEEGDSLDYRADVHAWIDAMNNATTAQEQWQVEFRQELLLQWPGYWADEMLKRSGA